MLVNTRLNLKENQTQTSFSNAILNPSAKHGGLYALDKLPYLDEQFFDAMSGVCYDELALSVIEKFGFDLEISAFKSALQRYKNFDNSSAVNMVKFSENVYINELWHGPTRAFKDMALQPFGEILSTLAKKDNKKYLIMCATSGDTGPATLESFKDMENIKVICIYPKDGTSQTQRLQMVNATGKNVKSIGINGNFDDAQRILKTLLKDDDFISSLNESEFNLSAANSVNFGRILFQIIYHIYAYIFMKNQGFKQIDIIVPSGNFGNALGAYYAKKMGAKISKIKIASNQNNILTEFFNTGIYDLRDKKLVKTISPAMDILISSNIERLLFDKFGPFRTKELMDSLNQNNFYKISNVELLALKDDFEASFCSDDECCAIIKKCSDMGILVDPHTATCFKMLNDNPSVVTSTAQWLKFTPSMIGAIYGEYQENEFESMKNLAHKFGVKLPDNIVQTFASDEIHKEILAQNEIKEFILDWIKK